MLITQINHICIILYSIAFHCVVLYCVALHCIELYCIVLYCIVSGCTYVYQHINVLAWVIYYLARYYYCAFRNLSRYITSHLVNIDWIFWYMPSNYLAKLNILYQISPGWAWFIIVCSVQYIISISVYACKQYNWKWVQYV